MTHSIRTATDYVLCFGPFVEPGGQIHVVMRKDAWNAMPILPKHEVLLGVIGGHHITADARRMAEFLGYAIIEAGYNLVTGGQRGAGEYATRGALANCVEHGHNVSRHVFAVVPWGNEPGFCDCRVVHAGRDTFERGIVLMNRTRTVFVVGGGAGTEHEIMHAAVDDYMAWGTANIIPVSGTGGVAERVLERSHRYDDPILDAIQPSPEKAKRLVASIDKYHFSLLRFWDVDIHEGWLSGDKHPVVRRTYKIRHYFNNENLRIEGE